MPATDSLSTAPSINVQDKFYEQFWTKPGWSGQIPNQDEMDRYQAIKTLVDRIALPKDKTKAKILDVGCGRGWLTHLLASEGEVLGIDLLPASVQHAQRLFPQLIFRAVSTADLIQEMATPAFDLVVCSEVIEHIPATEKQRFLSDLYQLIKPGGHLILTTPRGDLWRRWHQSYGKGQPIEAWHTEQQLAALCQSVGFVTLARTHAHHTQQPLNWQGWVRKYVLNRRYIRNIHIPRLSIWFDYAASFYQVSLLRR